MNILPKKPIAKLPIQTPPVKIVQKDVILPKGAGPIYDEGARLLNIEKYHKLFKLFGKGKVFVIIDDGFSPHPNLNTPIEIKSYGYRETTSTSGHGNGTHGVIGMIGNPIVAPVRDGRPVHKKVLGTAGGSPTDINDALTDFLNSPYLYANCSFGAPGTYSHRPTEETLKKIKEADKIVCVATGNEGASLIGWPSNSEHVFAIGAIEFDDDLAPFSNAGKGIDFVSWGHLVLVPNKNGGHDKSSGTSFSCPYALACIIMYHEYFERLFGYTPGWQETYDILRTYARDLTKYGYDFETGHGLITLDGIDDNFEKYIKDYGREDLRKKDPEWEGAKEDDTEEVTEEESGEGTKPIKEEPVKEGSPCKKKWWLARIICILLR